MWPNSSLMTIDTDNPLLIDLKESKPEDEEMMIADRIRKLNNRFNDIIEKLKQEVVQLTTITAKTTSNKDKSEESSKMNACLE